MSCTVVCRILRRKMVAFSPVFCRILRRKIERGSTWCRAGVCRILRLKWWVSNIGSEIGEAASPRPSPILVPNVASENGDTSSPWSFPVFSESCVGKLRRAPHCVVHVCAESCFKNSKCLILDRRIVKLPRHGLPNFRVGKL